MAKGISFDIDADAIALVTGERQTWSDAEVFITENIAFKMRNVIRKLRRNYWGIFQTPHDPITGKEKIWIPYTEILVNNVRKNIDLDTKDVHIRATAPKFIGLIRIVRAIVRNFLVKVGFGEKLDRLLSDVAIDGTKVWKTFDGFDNETKERSLTISEPDLLNIYIDPASESIQQAYRITERALLSKDQMRAMKGWENVEDATELSNLPRQDADNVVQSSTTSTSKFVDVWELWGQIPKHLITGEAKDFEDKKMVEGHIVVSGIEGGTSVRHLIEENKKGRKPYEEAWYEKVSGRWYGRGVAEKVMWLQLWINTVVNIRINRASVSQLGIFKIKRGSGITPQMIGKLAANGAIPVNNIEDIEQFVMQEASLASYKDEATIWDIGRMVTSTFEVATGEQLPSETTATAASIQSSAAASQFVLIKEGVGHFIERWVNRHVIPFLQKNVKIQDLITIADDQEELQALDEVYINFLTAKAIQEKTDAGRLVDAEQVVRERQSALEKMAKMGIERFVRLIKAVDFTKFVAEIDVTNEKMDRGVIMNNLVMALQAAPEMRLPIIKELFDLMGLSISEAELNRQLSPQPTPATQQNQTPQQLATQANAFTR